jgi:hypothetical protein
VGSLMKSLDIQEVMPCPPSERGVACPSPIQPEGTKLNNYSPEEVLQVGLIIMDSLCREMCSSDMLYLAFSSAKDRLEKTSMDKDKVKSLFNRYVSMADAARKRHPFADSGFFP